MWLGNGRPFNMANVDTSHLCITYTSYNNYTCIMCYDCTCNAPPLDLSIIIVIQD